MSLGFIILRHVRCENTNSYWIESYNCIRKFYPSNSIIIIDDNSNYDFITEIVLENTTIIQSEYKCSGELLPYIYYLRNPIFDKAVIIHDSVFFQKHIDFHQENMPLWNFYTNVSDRNLEVNLISKLDNMQPLLDLYNTNKWYGCFGGMSVITIDFLQKIHTKYNLENLIEHVKCRDDRMGIERVIGLIFSVENNCGDKSVFGSIFNFCTWGYLYSLYLAQKSNNQLPNIPVIKVWTGR